ncbi:unnamed protein product [Discosporangium mesarthrocarpum]
MFSGFGNIADGLKLLNLNTLQDDDPNFNEEKPHSKNPAEEVPPDANETQAQQARVGQGNGRGANGDDDDGEWNWEEEDINKSEGVDQSQSDRHENHGSGQEYFDGSTSSHRQEYEETHKRYTEGDGFVVAETLIAGEAGDITPSGPDEERGLHGNRVELSSLTSAEVSPRVEEEAPEKVELQGSKDVHTGKSQESERLLAAIHEVAGGRERAAGVMDAVVSLSMELTSLKEENQRQCQRYEANQRLSRERVTAAKKEQEAATAELSQLSLRLTAMQDERDSLGHQLQASMESVHERREFSDPRAAELQAEVIAVRAEAAKLREELQDSQAAAAGVSAAQSSEDEDGTTTETPSDMNESSSSSLLTQEKLLEEISSLRSSLAQRMRELEGKYSSVDVGQGADTPVETGGADHPEKGTGTWTEGSNGGLKSGTSEAEADGGVVMELGKALGESRLEVEGLSKALAMEKERAEAIRSESVSLRCVPLFFSHFFWRQLCNSPLHFPTLIANPRW